MSKKSLMACLLHATGHGAGTVHLSPAGLRVVPTASLQLVRSQASPRHQKATTDRFVSAANINDKSSHQVRRAVPDQHARTFKLMLLNIMSSGACLQARAHAAAALISSALSGSRGWLPDGDTMSPVRC